MLEVHNYKADRTFEFELRRLKEELPKENFCCQLEDYLRQGDWRKADEETAWLFYLVMVRQGYEDWDELYNKFPSGILNQIDQLWANYSQGHFGFSIQKRIWSSLGGDHWDTWEKFGLQVEWKMKSEFLGREWLNYYSMSFSVTESPEGQLPALVYQRTSDHSESAIEDGFSYEDSFNYEDMIFGMWGLNSCYLCPFFSRIKT